MRVSWRGLEMDQWRQTKDFQCNNGVAPPSLSSLCHWGLLGSLQYEEGAGAYPLSACFSHQRLGIIMPTLQNWDVNRRGADTLQVAFVNGT